MVTPDRTRDSDDTVADVSNSANYAGREFGSYRLLQKIGEGGMGTVYAAIHTKLEKTVAVKILPAHRNRSQQAINRFEREMKAIGKLDHPNIVVAHDAGVQDGEHYLAMEFVLGLDAATLVRQLGPLPVAAACEIVRQASIGIQHAHDNELVHRDVKPSNLMVTPSGDVKVLDLGLALFEIDPEEGIEHSELTSAGQIMGTLDYMAPEQLGDSHTVDHRADVYSLGATLYKLLSGLAPHESKGHDTQRQKLVAVATEPVEPIHRVCPGIPRALSEVLARALARNPRDRWASAIALSKEIEAHGSSADLSTLLQKASQGPSKSEERDLPTRPTLGEAEDTAVPGDAATSQPSSPIRRRWRQLLVTATLLSVVAVVAFAALRIDTSRNRTPNDESRISQDEVEPVSQIESGPPLSQLALVSSPARIEGVKSWSIETVASGGFVGGIGAMNCAVSPDSALLARVSHDSALRIHDLATGELVHCWVGHDLLPYRVDWSHDNKFIAMAVGLEQTNEVLIWEYPSGKRIANLPAYKTRCISWCPTRPILAFSQDNNLAIWDFNSTTLHELDGAGYAMSMAWSRNGKLLAIGDAYGKIRIWVPDEQRLYRLIDASPEAGLAVLELAWSPDGITLASGGADKRTKLWNAQTGELKKVLRSGTKYGGYAMGMAWSPDGSSLAMTNFGVRQFWSLELIEVETGKLIQDVALDAMNASGAHIHWSPDGKSIAASIIGAGGGGIRVLDVPDLAPRFHLNAIQSVMEEWTAQGLLMNAKTKDGRGGFHRFLCWDLEAGEKWRTSANLPDARGKVSPDSRLLATALHDRVVLFQNGHQVDQYPLASVALAWSADSQQLAMATRSQVILWTLANKASKTIDLAQDDISAVAWSSRNTLAIATLGGRVFLYDADGTRFSEMTHAEPVIRLAFSDDGASLAASEKLGSTISLWRSTDDRTWEHLVKPVPHLRKLEWRGNTLIIHGADGSLLSWAPDRIAPQPMPRSGPRFAFNDFSPDGELVARGHWKGVRHISPANGGARIGTITTLANGKFVQISPEGHYQANVDVSEDIVYAVELDSGVRLSLRPDAFATKYSWQNKPEQAMLGAE